MRSFTKVWLGISFIAIGLGLAILLIVTASGARWEKNLPTVSLNENYTGVTSLDVKIKYGKVTIIEGDRFQIEAEHVIENDLISTVSNGTWTIKNNKSNRDYNFLGFDIHIGEVFQWNADVTPDIVIMVPKGFAADQMRLEIGAGTLEADSLRTADGNFDVGAGSMKIDQLEVTGTSEYHVGAGYMALHNLKADSIKVDCGLGNIEIEGTVTGNSSIDNGVGKINMKLSGAYKDYSYKIDCGIGNIIVGDQRFHSTSSKRIVNENAESSLSLECGVGNITVDFN